MLDPDISTADALRHLSVEERDPLALDRRRFLQLVGMGVGAGVIASHGGSLLNLDLPGLDPTAWAAGPIGSNDGILIMIGMHGGNDGLNTVVSFNDGNYRQQHGALALSGARHAAPRRQHRPAPRAHRAQTILGCGPTRDRRGHRVSGSRPEPLLLDGQVDVGAADRPADVGLDRPVARRSHRFRQGPVRRGRDRPGGSPAPRRRTTAGHRGRRRTTRFRWEHGCPQRQDLRRRATARQR